ncbi:hypothetical protein ACFX16_025784 [Malus domestica]
MLIPPNVPSIEVDASDVLDDGNQTQENNFIYLKQERHKKYGQQRRAIIEAMRLSEDEKSKTNLNVAIDVEESNGVTSPHHFKDASKKWLKSEMASFNRPAAFENCVKKKWCSHGGVMCTQEKQKQKGKRDTPHDFLVYHLQKEKEKEKGASGAHEKQKQKRESKSKRKQKRKSRKEDASLFHYSTIPRDNMIKDKKMPTKVPRLHFLLDQKMPINMLKTCNLFFFSFGDICINPIRG